MTVAQNGKKMLLLNNGGLNLFSVSTTGFLALNILKFLCKCYSNTIRFEKKNPFRLDSFIKHYFGTTGRMI